MRDERGPWYLLTGFIIGLALGLAYAWVLSPYKFVDNTPASLRADFKDQYRALIAAAYAATGNLPRAEDRLRLLRDTDMSRSLAEQAQRSLAEGSDPRQAQALGLLAVALGQGPPALTPAGVASETPSASPSAPATLTATLTPVVAPANSAQSPVPVAQNSAASPGNPGGSVTRTPGATETPLPTRTPTLTPQALYVLQDQELVCAEELGQPVIQVFAEDQAGEPVAGVEVVVNWEGGEDHFFTGLKPELGLGYADFSMTPGVAYTLKLSGGGNPVPGLTPAECETQGGKRYWGSWQLVFVQP